MATGRNLVLCLATNYKFVDISPFVISWFRNVDNADLVIVSGDMDEAFDAAVERYGISVVRADFDAYPDVHRQTARFFRYREFLSGCRDRYAYSDEAGHAFRKEAGHLFRSEAGRRSDLMSVTFGGDRSGRVL